MDSKRSEETADADCIIHLTQHRGHWSVCISLPGCAALHHSTHRTGNAALDTAKLWAAVHQAALLISTLDRELVLVRPADVAGYFWHQSTLPPQPKPPGDAQVTVHLSEHRDGWRVTVTRPGRSSAFLAHHREADDALALAKQIAIVEGGDLLVLLLAGQGAGVDFVPAARVATYVLPIRPPRG